MAQEPRVIPALAANAGHLHGLTSRRRPPAQWWQRHLDLVQQASFKWQMLTELSHYQSTVVMDNLILLLLPREKSLTQLWL